MTQAVEDALSYKIGFAQSQQYAADPPVSKSQMSDHVNLAFFAAFPMLVFALFVSFWGENATSILCISSEVRQ